jgi:hypothetical protein
MAPATQEILADERAVRHFTYVRARARKEPARNGGAGFLIFQRSFLRGTGLGGAVKG